MDIKDVLALLNKETRPAKKIRERMEKWRNVYYDISLHTSGACPSFTDPKTGACIFPTAYYGREYQYRFDRFLMSRHPREGDDLRNWRYSQYRPMTKAPFSQCIEITAGAIFQDSNYHIEIPDRQDNDYIWGNHFCGYDLVGYISKIGLKCMVEDPNGLFVRMPKHAFYEQPDSRVEVELRFVNTKDMVYYDGRELVFKYDAACSGKGDGDYAFYLDGETIWRFTWNDEERKYELKGEDREGYYAHMFGRLPVTVAGGEWNTQGYFDSYFDKAKAVADDFIAAYSAAQMVDKEASHPYIVAVSEDCPGCNGVGRTQYCNACGHTGAGCTCEAGVAEYVLRNCGKCQGTGKQSRNPGQWLILTKEEMKDTDGIRFVSPDIGINTHHREVTRMLTEQLMKALHLYNTDKSESGSAKAIDQERMYKFISNISNDLFDKVITDTICDIIAYRNISSNSGMLAPAQYPFEITKPTQFQIKTTEQLLGELKAGREANVPTLIRMKLSEDYVEKAYSGDEEIKKKMRVVNALDPNAVLSTDEKLNLQRAGGITTEDVLFSQMLPVWLDELVQEKGREWFLGATVGMIKVEVGKKSPTPFKSPPMGETSEKYDITVPPHGGG